MKSLRSLAVTLLIIASVQSASLHFPKANAVAPDIGYVSLPIQSRQVAGAKIGGGPLAVQANGFAYVVQGRFL